MHRTYARVSPALLALAMLGAPRSVSAQTTTTGGSITIGAFGHHTTSGSTPNFAVQPIGLDECNIPLPITINGLNTGSTMHYFNIYTGAAAAVTTCATPANRASTTLTTCHHITDVPYTSGMSYTFSSSPPTLTAAQLEGGTCASNTIGVFFYDATMENDVSTTFSTYWVLSLTVDADPPSAPSLATSIAGDTTVALSWTNPSDIGIQGGVNVYVDPNGCSGSDGGVSSSLLVMGNPAPNASSRAFQQLSMSVTSTSLATTALGWNSSTYGNQAAIAITVMDSALNESVLSNVVCAQHVQVTGFWEQYCAEHGMPDVAQCTANYHGCSVALPGRREDLPALAFGLGVFGVLIARRGRRRSR